MGVFTLLTIFFYRMKYSNYWNYEILIKLCDSILLCIDLFENAIFKALQH